jgi:predicted porin
MAFAVGAALAPCAHAQVKSPAGTDWEFYGKFYPELTHARGDGATAPGTTGLSTLVGTLGGNAIIPRWEMQISNTYIGFRGSKDMGSGSKAIFQLESQAAIDESGGQLATRDSFVGLANQNYGTVRLGFMDTPFKKYGDVLGFLGVSSGNFVSTSNVLRKTGFGTSSTSSFHLRRGNAVDYASPVVAGFQSAVQYSIGNPTEGGITTSPKRDPHVASWGIKWEQGPFYAAFLQEAHFDLFGGSCNVATASNCTGGTRTNFSDPSVHSKDLANQVALVYKIGVHSIEADYITKKYKEDNVTVNGRFQEYKNNAYMLVLESRWSNSWRTALHYIKSTKGDCTLLNVACTTDGLDGSQISVGVAYYTDPSFYIFGLYSKLTNGSSARYNNSSQTPNPGEDITQGSVGIAYNF